MSVSAPYVGFGDPDVLANFAFFSVEIQGNEDVYPDWDSELLSATRQIAGSSNFVTQVQGNGPATMTLSVAFDSRDQYRLFRTFQGTKQSLVLIAGFTSYDGDIRTINDLDYECFHDTMLLRISNPQNRIGGIVECAATFMRAGESGVTW